MTNPNSGPGRDSNDSGRFSSPGSMNPRHFLLLLSLLSFATPTVLHAQEREGGIRYQFTPGEEIRYRIIAVDSIVMYDRLQKNLARRRVEIVRYRCDSILPDGNYLMTVEWTDYAATERLDTLPEIIRTTHPWIGHPRTFIMSPTGHRIDMVRYDRFHGSAPGGPFAPLAIPFLGDSVAVHGNDVFTNKQWLFDNVFPPVGWSGTTYRNLQGKIDTLGEMLDDIELTETAAVQYKPAGLPDSIVTHSRINGAGRYFVSSSKGYPVGGTYDLIADVTLTNAHGEEIQGRHVMSTIFELYNDQPTPDEPAQKQKSAPSPPPSATPRRR